MGGTPSGSSGSGDTMKVVSSRRLNQPDVNVIVSAISFDPGSDYAACTESVYFLASRDVTAL